MSLFSLLDEGGQTISMFRSSNHLFLNRIKTLLYRHFTGWSSKFLQYRTVNIYVPLLDYLLTAVMYCCDLWDKKNNRKWPMNGQFPQHKKIPLIVDVEPPPGTAHSCLPNSFNSTTFFFTLFIVHPLTIFCFFFFFRFVNRPDIDNKIRRVIF